MVACEKQLDGNIFGAPDDETPTMHGFADMVLARANGQHVIFDFKWTTSKRYHQELLQKLQKNRSSQLAIYAELLSALTKDRELPTAYFLMPLGRLFSIEEFNSYWATKLNVSEGCEGNVINKIVSAYRYRREEIMSGKIEMGERRALNELSYFNDTELHNLFPLKSDKDGSLKEVNHLSNFGLFKG